MNRYDQRVADDEELGALRETTKRFVDRDVLPTQDE